jgi:hypothetical protein
VASPGEGGAGNGEEGIYKTLEGIHPSIGGGTDCLSAVQDLRLISWEGRGAEERNSKDETIWHCNKLKLFTSLHFTILCDSSERSADHQRKRWSQHRNNGSGIPRERLVLACLAEERDSRHQEERRNERKVWPLGERRLSPIRSGRRVVRVVFWSLKTQFLDGMVTVIIVIAIIVTTFLLMTEDTVGTRGVDGRMS